MKSVALLFCALTFVSGCGATAPRSARIAPLPELPFALEDGPRELRMAWTRAETLLAEPSPEVPPEGFSTLDEAGDWANERVLPWAHDHLERMSDITDPLAGAVALDGTLRVFAASIAALLYERMIEVMLAIPVPEEIAGDAALVEAYRAAFFGALGGTVNDTRGFLEECVATASARDDAAAWGRDCEARLARLPVAPPP